MGIDELPPQVVEAWKRRTVGRDLARFRELFGPHVPEDLGRARSDEVPGFLVATPDAALGAPNAFVHFVLAAQAASPVVLRQAFCGVWFVASIPAEGDTILAHCDRQGLAQVVR